jgi:hypothetical protein
MPIKNVSQHETADYEALYRMLRRKLIKAGCLRRTPWHHIRDGLLVICLYSCGYYVLLADPEWEIRLLALGLLAFSNVQAGYIEVAERVVQWITPRESAQKAANGRSRYWQSRLNRSPTLRRQLTLARWEPRTVRDQKDPYNGQ